MATIFVVTGSSGYWADASTWNVCFKTTKEAAEEVRALCQRQADEYNKWREKRRSLKKSFFKRHTQLENDEFYAEEQAKRAAMFDKWFSYDREGARYRVETVSEDPAVDPSWIERQQWLADYQAKQVAEQMRHCTVDDRSAFAKLGDLLKLTLK